MKPLLSKTLALALALCAAGPLLAADLNPLLADDQLAVFLFNISSQERNTEQVRVRSALCVEFNKCKELTSSPIAKVASGETIDYTKKEVRQRRSEVFLGKEINKRISDLAREKSVRNPKPQVAVMLARVDGNGKIIEKSDSVYLDFPKKDDTGKPEKGAKTVVLQNDVKLTLHKLEANASVAVERKVKN